MISSLHFQCAYYATTFVIVVYVIASETSNYYLQKLIENWGLTNYLK